MRFHADHRFHGSPTEVAAVLSDPGFYERLDLPDLSEPELVANETSSGESLLRLRYEFVGSLDPIARRLLGSQHLAWIQEVRIDSSKGSGALSFGAEKDPKRLHGSATFTLEPDGAESVRHLEGELVVAVPGIGGMAERRIVPGLLRRLDIEAAAVDEALGSA